jgi:hypothetical protein
VQAGEDMIALHFEVLLERDALGEGVVWGEEGDCC